MVIDQQWFTEECDEGGSAFSMKLKQKVYEEKTPYQVIEIYETEFFGTLMTLDGFVMLTDRDNFIYHEMMTHPALFTHPQPRSVLIVGGGDCGGLREVLKHAAVEHVDMVEIDERVTRVAERFFPQLCEMNGDSRAYFHFTDGIKWVNEAPSDRYDVIIIDSTDPVGPAAGLYSEPFYRDCFAALSGKGVLIAQSESPLFHIDLIRSMRRAMTTAGFSEVVSLNFPQCTYPSGWWTATMGCKGVRSSEFRRQDAANKGFECSYYNDGIHGAALVVPTFFGAALR
ncbi:MAG: polyamine aminopropyltransferase [Acidiferrobacterales bacterium]